MCPAKFVYSSSCCCIGAPQTSLLYLCSWNLSCILFWFLGKSFQVDHHALQAVCGWIQAKPARWSNHPFQNLPLTKLLTNLLFPNPPFTKHFFWDHPLPNNSFPDLPFPNHPHPNIPFPSLPTQIIPFQTFYSCLKERYSLSGFLIPKSVQIKLQTWKNKQEGGCG